MRTAPPLTSPDLLTVAEHRAAILAVTGALPAESVPLGDAAGRTLAHTVHAAVDVPRFDNSAMDGYAVLFTDVAAASPSDPVELRVIADLPAGSVDEPVLRPGFAARIMTGAPVPPTATAVVPLEHTRDGLRSWNDAVVVERAPARPGSHIRRRGEELHAGAAVVPAGSLLGPLQLTAIAASGVDAVSVTRRPRVAVVSTGSELAAPGAEVSRARIPESNSVLLASLCRATGAEIVAVSTVADDDATFAARIDRAIHVDGADVVVTSGGVSAGTHEVVRNVLAGRIAFRSVAMQPGRPQAFGVIDGTLVFGLPGNPASAAASFEAFVRPALLALQGRQSLTRPTLRVAVAAAWRSPADREQYVPVMIDRTDPGAWTTRPATVAGSSAGHPVAGLANADGYAVIPASVTVVSAGDLVDVALLP